MKSKFIIAASLVCFICSSNANGQDVVQKRVYNTTYITGKNSPKVDGKIDDQVWDMVEWSGNYIEWSPEENTDPTEQTFIKILYDDKNLYVAFRCLDKDPKGVVRRLSRRDAFDGDWVEINIDSNRDLRTAFSFTITAAGVRGEEFINNNGAFWDATWNPIWFAKTSLTEEGWTAEMRIPLSQLRFGEDDDQVWGIQSTRRYFRKEERSLWQRTPLNAPGWVSEFGELHGLNNLKKQKNVEIQPYTVSSLETFEAEPGNPFRDGSDSRITFGLDGKYGVTNDLTLDFTFNPDFGQVEADPSAIALDGFQIFFPEQRPFFIESKNIFDYRFSTSRSGSTFGFDNLFYSRRIGRAPQGFPALGANDFVDQPDITTILGAAKFSGKTQDGWSIGVLQSTTENEKAVISNLGIERRESVEPLTNYFVSRIQKDLNNRNTFVGGIFTATNRDLSDNLDFLHRSAYSGGIDFNHQWKNRTWYVAGNFVVSQVNGSEAAITRTQQSIAHLFQRTDASHLSVDNTKTSLTGTGGNLQFGKASGNWRFETGGTWRSPGLELNDIGFQRQADDLRSYTWVGYRTTKPLQKVRSFAVNYTQILAYDFEGNFNDLSLNVNGWVNLKNNWWINGGVNYRPLLYSNSALRGGPRLRISSEYGYRNGIISDSRKKFRYSVNHSFRWATDDSYRTFNVNGSVTYQPTNALQVSLLPSFTINDDKLQYVTTSSLNNDPRYINAEIEQQTLGFPLRVDYILRPALSLQYWGQPFISRGLYSNFKHVNNASASNFEDRFIEYAGTQVNLNNGIYSVDEDRDGTSDFTFFQPDFSFVQWRSNLVLRWEYIAGSEIFLVWSQDVSQFGDIGDNLFQGLQSNIINTEPQNIFLIKVTYRFMK